MGRGMERTGGLCTQYHKTPSFGLSEVYGAVAQWAPQGLSIDCGLTVRPRMEAVAALGLDPHSPPRLGSQNPHLALRTPYLVLRHTIFPLSPILPARTHTPLSATLAFAPFQFPG